ncbi:MAG: glycosyltransferase family 2 protein [Bacteroidetes bacterium]|nr:glycosyltransferase family 2 protein [Bacteroidota bacterium]MDA1120982.1 glycosyltransferase family 2 protein [Bacteroidota bacterium]
MDYPKITIITPSFNQAQFIEQTIDSVLSQNYPNLEYYVFDGGSTDGSADIINKFEKHLTYWESKPDKGQSDAINKGLRMATGEIVNWLNSDDFYEPDALTFVAEAFDNPTTNVVCGKSKIVDEAGRVVSYSNGTDIYPENLSKTIGWARIDQPETFFRKRVVDKMGLLTTTLNFVMDKDWWVRYLAIFGLEGIKEIDDKLVNFRLHDSSKTNNHQKQFEIETNTLFHSLCLANNLNEAKQIAALGIDNSIDLDDIVFDSSQSAIHYYLLKKADETYYQQNDSLARKLLSQINPKLLKAKDVRLYEKLLFRSQFIPGWLRNTVK